MKLIIRADDYGYTMPHNLGTIEAIKQGIVTTVDIMLDTPGTMDGLERIKAFPHISIGWHGGHFWGKPVSDPQQIPSLLDDDGNFKFRVNQELKNDVVYEEALIECRAQILRCLSVLSKVPDVTSFARDTLFDRARKQVCDEFGIKYDYMTKTDRLTRELSKPLPEFEPLGIYMPTQHDSVYKVLYSEYASERQLYDPVAYFVNDEDQLLKHKAVITAWHPGYLDDYVYEDSSKRFNLARVIDIKALCSKELKQWIIDQQVELVNMRDILYGTREYQNYLKVTGSPLYIEESLIND